MSSRHTSHGLQAETSMAMSNYQLGEPLGKGASAQVYKALNWTTGETVAIKKISVSDIPRAELGDIMSEIDLLKNLNNENIVKYKGFFKTNDYLHIILEYCENGSLQYILKRYGKFPEDLVAVYISQVLQGLIYLHSQGVIHRDIKGANILTNKDGTVKLADFGVATMMPGLQAGGVIGDGLGSGADESVVGSPYWMAPEVIEQNGATTASDIWSVGCVTIELLEGQPPYHTLEPMQALFRIVQDDSPPIPEGASGMVKDFMCQCFQKDPNLRITAQKLAKHPWMMASKRQIESSRPRDASESPKQSDQAQIGSGLTRQSDISPTASRTGKTKLVIKGRKPSTQSQAPIVRVDSSRLSQAGPEGPQTGSQDSSAAGKAISDLRRRPLTTVYDDAIQRVQEWNEALQAVPKASPKVLRRVAKAQPQLGSQPPRMIETSGMAESSSGESLAAHLASVGRKPNGMWARPLGNTAEAEETNESSDQDGSVWDDDFADAPDVRRFAKAHTTKGPRDEPDNMKTIKPTKSPLGSPPEVGRSISSIGRFGTGSSSLFKDDSSEDYSDLALPDDNDFANKLQRFKVNGVQSNKIYRPEDIIMLSLRGTPGPSRPSSSRDIVSSLSQRPRLGSGGSFGSGSSRSPSRRSSFRFTPADDVEQLKATERELSKYAEGEEEDYDDVFGVGEAMKGEMDPVSSTSEILKLGTRRSDRSWMSGQLEDDDYDPFADIEDSYSVMDVEANLLRDKHSSLCAIVSAIIERLQATSTEERLLKDTTELYDILEGAPALQDHFIMSHGMLAVLEVLESAPSREVILNLLRIVNLMVATEPSVLENLCLIGAIPILKTFTGRRYSLETRLEAATFVGALTGSALTLQMFISCRGLRVLIELLDEDYSTNRDLVLSALRGVASVFELQTPTPKNDFCRMFIREGIVEPLGTALLHILKDETEGIEGSKQQIVGIVLMFCQTAQADSRMRDALGTRSFIKRLLRACGSLTSSCLTTVLKAIKHLSTSPSLLDVLQNADAIAVLIKVLDDHLARAGTNEICSHIFQTLFNLCRLSRIRQEEAAINGVIPILQRALSLKSPLKEFALPILCDMVNAGKTARRQLWKYGGVQVYLDLLSDAYWKVAALEAIVFWLQDETARVEDELSQPQPLQALSSAFIEASGASFEAVLEPFLRLLRASPLLTIALAGVDLFKRIREGLTRKAKALTKLNLLRIIKVACDHHPQHQDLVTQYGLSTTIQELGRQDEAVLVRQLAKEIAPGLASHVRSPPGSVKDHTPRPAAVRRTTSALAPKPERPDHQKHKRKISRNHLTNIHWTEQDGKITPVIGRSLDTPTNGERHRRTTSKISTAHDNGEVPAQERIRSRPYTTQEYETS